MPERKIVFDLSDIQYIRLQCRFPSCQQETSISLADNNYSSIPDTCPYCHGEWMHDTVDCPERDFLYSMETLRVHQVLKSRHLRLQFEIEEN